MPPTAQTEAAGQGSAQSQPGCAASPANAGSEPSAAFTPGPWEVRAYETTFEVRSLDGINVVSTSWHSVHRKPYPLKDEAQANARLITAAPDLLHAAQCARIKLSRYRQQHPETWVGGVLAEYEAVIQLIDAAIAKASA